MIPPHTDQPRPLRRPALAAAVLALLAVASADATEVEVTLVDGATVRGRVVASAPRLELTVEDETRTFEWSELLEVVTSADPATAGDGTSHEAAPPGAMRFHLSDGSRFRAEIVEAPPRSLTVRLDDGQTLRIALAGLRAVAIGPDALDRLASLDAGAQGDESRDLLAVRRPDDAPLELRGRCIDVGAEQIRFAWNDRELPVRWDRIAFLRLHEPVRRNPASLVHLRSSDRFGGRVVDGDDRQLVLSSPLFETVRLDWESIERIECDARGVIFLSDARPMLYDFEPFFEKEWPLGMNETLTGDAMQLAGRTYRKGIVMHSRSRLSFAIGGRFATFAAQAGILDAMDARGNATLRVLGDGRELWKATDVRGGESPRRVLVDVNGVDELTLEVDFGDGLDLSDHVLWAMPRLIR